MVLGFFLADLISRTVVTDYVSLDGSFCVAASYYENNEKLLYFALARNYFLYLF